MKKIFIGFILLTSCSFFANAIETNGIFITNNFNHTTYNKKLMDTKFLAGINASYLMTPLDWQDRFVFAGGLQFDYFISNTVAIGLKMSFSKTSISDKNADYLLDNHLNEDIEIAIQRQRIPDTTKITGFSGYGSYIPADFHVKFLLPSLAQNAVRPYAALGLAFNIVTQSVDITYNVPRTRIINDIESRSGLDLQAFGVGLSPEIGTLFNINELWNIDLNARYNILFSSELKSSFAINLGIVFNLSHKY